ncbi:hypothetical protein QTN25_006447 [Entamoeba marina]
MKRSHKTFYGSLILSIDKKTKVGTLRIKPKDIQGIDGQNFDEYEIQRATVQVQNPFSNVGLDSNVKVGKINDLTCLYGSFNPTLYICFDKKNRDSIPMSELLSADNKVATSPMNSCRTIVTNPNLNFEDKFSTNGSIKIKSEFFTADDDLNTIVTLHVGYPDNQFPGYEELPKVSSSFGKYLTEQARQSAIEKGLLEKEPEVSDKEVEIVGNVKDIYYNLVVNVTLGLLLF